MKKSDKGLGLGTILFIVFLILKLCGTIDWSWWWVTAPIWIPLSISVVLVILVAVLAPSEFKEGVKDAFR